MGEFWVVSLFRGIGFILRFISTLFWLPARLIGKVTSPIVTSDVFTNGGSVGYVVLAPFRFLFGNLCPLTFGATLAFPVYLSLILSGGQILVAIGVGFLVFFFTVLGSYSWSKIYSRDFLTLEDDYLENVGESWFDFLFFIFLLWVILSIVRLFYMIHGLEGKKCRAVILDNFFLSFAVFFSIPFVLMHVVAFWRIPDSWKVFRDPLADSSDVISCVIQNGFKGVWDLLFVFLGAFVLLTVYRWRFVRKAIKDRREIHWRIFLEFANVIVDIPFIFLGILVLFGIWRLPFFIRSLKRSTSAGDRRAVAFMFFVLIIADILTILPCVVVLLLVYRFRYFVHFMKNRKAISPTNLGSDFFAHILAPHAVFWVQFGGILLDLPCFLLFVFVFIFHYRRSFIRWNADKRRYFRAETLRQFGLIVADVISLPPLVLVFLFHYRWPAMWREIKRRTCSFTSGSAKEKNSNEEESATSSTSLQANSSHPPTPTPTYSQSNPFWRPPPVPRQWASLLPHFLYFKHAFFLIKDAFLFLLFVLLVLTVFNVPALSRMRGEIAGLPFEESSKIVSDRLLSMAGWLFVDVFLVILSLPALVNPRRRKAITAAVAATSSGKEKRKVILIQALKGWLDLLMILAIPVVLALFWRIPTLIALLKQKKRVPILSFLLFVAYALWDLLLIFWSLFVSIVLFRLFPLVRDCIRTLKFEKIRKELTTQPAERSDPAPRQMLMAGAYADEKIREAFITQQNNMLKSCTDFHADFDGSMMPFSLSFFAPLVGYHTIRGFLLFPHYTILVPFKIIAPLFIPLYWLIALLMPWHFLFFGSTKGLSYVKKVYLSFLSYGIPRPFRAAAHRRNWWTAHEFTLLVLWSLFLLLLNIPSALMVAAITLFVFVNTFGIGSNYLDGEAGAEVDRTNILIMSIWQTMLFPLFLVLEVVFLFLPLFLAAQDYRFWTAGFWGSHGFSLWMWVPVVVLWPVIWGDQLVHVIHNMYYVHTDYRPFATFIVAGGYVAGVAKRQWLWRKYKWLLARPTHFIHTHNSRLNCLLSAILQLVFLVLVIVWFAWPIILTIALAPPLPVYVFAVLVSLFLLFHTIRILVRNCYSGPWEGDATVSAPLPSQGRTSDLSGGFSSQRRRQLSATPDSPVLNSMEQRLRAELAAPHTHTLLANSWYSRGRPRRGYFSRLFDSTPPLYTPPAFSVFELPPMDTIHLYQVQIRLLGRYGCSVERMLHVFPKENVLAFGYVGEDVEKLLEKEYHKGRGVIHFQNILYSSIFTCERTATCMCARGAVFHFSLHIRDRLPIRCLVRNKFEFSTVKHVLTGLGEASFEAEDDEDHVDDASGNSSDDNPPPPDYPDLDPGVAPPAEEDDDQPPSPSAWDTEPGGGAGERAGTTPHTAGRAPSDAERASGGDNEGKKHPSGPTAPPEFELAFEEEEEQSRPQRVFTRSSASSSYPAPGQVSPASSPTRTNPEPKAPSAPPQAPEYDHVDAHPPRRVFRRKQRTPSPQHDEDGYNPVVCDEDQEEAKANVEPSAPPLYSSDGVQYHQAMY